MPALAWVGGPLPSTADGASWALIGKQLGWSLLAQTAGVLCCALLRGPWKRAAPRTLFKTMQVAQQSQQQPLSVRFRAWVEHRLGTADKPPEDPRLIYALLALDVCFSSLTVGFWIEKTYHYGVRQWVAVVELIFAAFYCLNYFVRLARRGFTAGAPWQAWCLLDAFCAVPLLLQGTTNRAWLSLTYMRSLAVMWAFEALHASGATARMSELRVRVIQAVLRLGALVFCFAGTMLIVEFLGDIGALTDKFLEAEMGAISFHQMCYYTLVTISTIGYGDFSPHTLLGRTLLLFIILGGVAFFSYETSELLALRAIEASGRGSFRPRRRRHGAGAAEPHLLVCGGAVAAGSATLAEFLAEVLHPGRGEAGVPEVVVLCEGEPAPALHALLARRWARHHATMLAGSPMVPKDLARARAADADMAIVLADLTAADAAAEDEETLLAAAALHRLHPGLPLRVLLIRRESKRLAHNAGLPHSSVIAAHDLGPRLAALGVRCPGAAALVSNLVRTAPRVRGASRAAAGNAPEQPASSEAPTPGAADAPPARWVLDYAAGAAHSLHGVLLGPRLDGRDFHAAASALFAAHGVILVAVQHQGFVVLSPRPGSPQALLAEGDVAFALALSAEHVAYAVAHVTLPPKAGGYDDAEASRHGGGESKHDSAARAAVEGAAARAWKAAFHAARHAAHAAAMHRAQLEASKRYAERTLSSMASFASPDSVGHQRNASLGGLMRNIAAFSGLRDRIRTDSGVAAALPPAGASPGPTPRRPSRRAQLRQLHAAAPTATSRATGAFSAEEAVDAMVEGGGHVVVVSLDPRTHAWAQVEGVLEALRQPFLPQPPPVVVLCAAPPPAALQQRFGPATLLFVDAGAGAASGDVAATDWGAVLLQAGVDTAAGVLYLAGEPPPRTRAAATMVDRRAVLFATVLETHCAAWGRDVFAAVELHNPHSVWHLRQTLHASAMGKAAARGGGGGGLARRHALTALAAEGSSGALAATLAAEASHAAHGNVPRSHLVAAAEFAAQRCSRPTATARQLARAPFAAAAALAAAALAAAAPRSVARGSDPVLHARFAAGRVLLRTDAARLMASVFFTPGAIEIVTAMGDPLGERQAVMLWRVELDDSPLLTDASLGLDGVPTTFGELFDRCAAAGATALGLERRRDDGGGSTRGMLPFIAACPRPDEPLRAGDALIALATPQWARANSPEYAAVRLLDATLKVQAAWRAHHRHQQPPPQQQPQPQQQQPAEAAPADAVVDETPEEPVFDDTPVPEASPRASASWTNPMFDADESGERTA